MLDHRQLYALTDAHSREFKHTALMYSYFYTNCTLCMMRASASYLAACKSHHFCTFWHLWVHSGCDSIWSTIQPFWNTFAIQAVDRGRCLQRQNKNSVFISVKQTVLWIVTPLETAMYRAPLHTEGPYCRIMVKQTIFGHITATVTYQ